MNDTDTPLVWLLDDDKAIRDSLSMLLECEGFPVRVFETGAGLLEGLPDRPQGCLLLDLDMPGMDGFAVMAALRERGIQIPIIIITGRGDGAEATDVLRAGARCLLRKPVSDDMLFAALRDATADLDPAEQ